MMFISLSEGDELEISFNFSEEVFEITTNDKGEIRIVQTAGMALEPGQEDEEERVIYAAIDSEDI